MIKKFALGLFGLIVLVTLIGALVSPSPKTENASAAPAPNHGGPAAHQRGRRRAGRSTDPYRGRRGRGSRDQGAQDRRPQGQRAKGPCGDDGGPAERRQVRRVVPGWSAGVLEVRADASSSSSRASPGPTPATRSPTFASAGISRPSRARSRISTGRWRSPAPGSSTSCGSRASHRPRLRTASRSRTADGVSVPRLAVALSRVLALAGVAAARADAAQGAQAIPTGSTGPFSAGDLMMVSVLLRLRPSGLLDEFPTLAAYVARGEARAACERAFAAQR